MWDVQYMCDCHLGCYVGGCHLGFYHVGRTVSVRCGFHVG